MTEWKVGDVVDVVDRRDGAIVERTTITKLTEETAYPPPGGWYATVAAGYRVSIRCLRRPPSDADLAGRARLRMNSALDLTGADEVQVQVKQDGTVLWVNVDGVCVLRICRMKNLTIVDERPDAGKLLMELQS